MISRLEQLARQIEQEMAFNAGSLAKSIKMKTTDYQTIVQAQSMSFSNGTVQNVSDNASH